MTSYYIVREDMNYENNYIKYISQVEELAIKWCLKNTDPKRQQISLIKYEMSDEGLLSETTIYIPYPK